MRTYDTVVVGGGLAGLGAATLLAKAGQRVALLERSALGGRARSKAQGGFTLNLGPHALYRTGAARALVDELGVKRSGGVPTPKALGLRDGVIGALPFDAWSAVRTKLFTAGETWEFARWVAGIPLGRPESLAGRSVADWLSELSPGAAGACAAFVRVSTYCADLDQLDAGAALQQLQRALRNVEYLDGGWQTLIDGLASAAKAAGVEVCVETPVRAVDGGTVRTDDGDWEGGNVVLAVAPAVAAQLTGSEALRDRAAGVRPVRAACLDLALSGAIPAGRTLLLGVDRPLYISAHTPVADLAPKGHTLVHAAVYGAHGEADALLAELHRALDGMWPDWRERTVFERWMPSMIVANDVPQPGIARQAVQVSDRPGTWVVGDWVGPEGMLADAAAASAGQAVRGILDATREAAA